MRHRSKLNVMTEDRQKLLTLASSFFRNAVATLQESDNYLANLKDDYDQLAELLESGGDFELNSLRWRDLDTFIRLAAQVRRRALPWQQRAQLGAFLGQNLIIVANDGLATIPASMVAKMLANGAAMANEAAWDIFEDGPHHLEWAFSLGLGVETAFGLSAHRFSQDVINEMTGWLEKCKILLNGSQEHDLDEAARIASHAYHQIHELMITYSA